jgi:hypothetical protein
VRPRRRHPTCQKAAALGRRPTSSVNVPAASTLLDHPRTVYLRQADLPPPPGRLAHGLVDPANLDATLDALTSCRRVHRGW